MAGQESQSYKNKNPRVVLGKRSATQVSFIKGYLGAIEADAKVCGTLRDINVHRLEIRKLEVSPAKVAEPHAEVLRGQRRTTNRIKG